MVTDSDQLDLFYQKMNVIQEIERIKEAELEAGIYGGLSKGSWHEKYSESAWVYLGGFSYELSEGDIICVMSQWGEIEDINLIRDKATGKSQGFAFVKYEDQRSTILAVDNFNGIKLLGRVLRCDHVDKYKLPKDIKDAEAEKLANNPDEKINIGAGHAYSGLELENEHDIHKGVDLWNHTSSSASSKPEINKSSDKKSKKEKKEKKGKKKHKKEHKKEHRKDEAESDSDRASDREGRVKRQKEDHSEEDEEDDRRGRERRSDSRDKDRSRRGDSRDRRDRSRDRERDNRDSRRRDDSRDRDRRGDRDSRGGDRNRREREEAEAEEARRIAALHAEKQAATAHRAFGGSASVGAYKGPVLPPGEAPMTSWRGKRDPLLIAASQFSGRKPMNSSSSSSSSGGGAPEPPQKRDEFAGFGGMKRLR